MKVYEVHNPDGTGSGVWACGECHRPYRDVENPGAAEFEMPAEVSGMVYIPESQRGPRNCQWCGNPTGQKTYLTLERYLEIDRASERGREFYKGEMLPLWALSLRHSIIVDNVSSLLRAHLNGGPCNIAGNVRLQVTPEGCFMPIRT